MKFAIFVTSKCNLRCKYCYEGNEKLNKDMTLDTADKTIEFIIDRLKFSEDERRPLRIIFHGGEPLLNFELVRYMTDSILDKVKDRKVIFEMTTNGTIMTPGIIGFIKSNIDTISVSIDGTKKSHNLNRIFANGTGSYDLAISNAKQLLSEGINVRARMTFNSQSVYEMYEGVRELSNLGFKYVVPAIDYYDKNWEKEHIEILKKQVFNILNIKNLYPNTCISLVELDLLNVKKGDCFGGINSFSINSDGKIYPCTFCVGSEEFIIGDINENKLLDKKISDLCIINQSENKDCIGCTRYEYCDGVRCKILNKLITNNFTMSPGIICELQKIKVSTIKKLAKNY